ncbi:hypothetical protein [Flavobacterium olei]|uniref:hypothetical protein n=1 Tax=Flavobacterium olei TaxID=1886782 RepID=UPI00321A57ED
MRVLAKFVSDLSFEGDFKKQPIYLQEAFELLLDTEFGNDLVLRQKMLSCLKTSRDLVKVLSQFTDKQIQKVCNNVIMVKAI